MTPKEYLDRYTNLKFFSPWNNEQITVSVSGYGSGMGSNNGNRGDISVKCSREYTLLRDAMRVAHHGNAKTAIKEKPFKFDSGSYNMGCIPASEEFYGATFINALGGKGSPDEIADTLRIAMAVGRIGSGRDAAGQRAACGSVAEYVKSFITIDCNGLVKNYYGASSDYIGFYAAPARRRAQAAHVRVGDCLVTHNAAAPYEHIALVADWDVVGTDETQKTIRIVEWGEAGDESKHYSQPRTLTIKKGPVSSLGVGFEAPSHHKGGGMSFRYIFAPPGPIESHGWLI